MSESSGGENHRGGAGSEERCACKDHTTLYERAVNGICDRSPRLGAAVVSAENKVLGAVSRALQALSAGGWVLLAPAALGLYLVLRG